MARPKKIFKDEISSIEDEKPSEDKKEVKKEVVKKEDELRKIPSRYHKFLRKEN